MTKQKHDLGWKKYRKRVESALHDTMTPQQLAYELVHRGLASPMITAFEPRPRREEEAR